MSKGKRCKPFAPPLQIQHHSISPAHGSLAGYKGGIVPCQLTKKGRPRHCYDLGIFGMLGMGTNCANDGGQCAIKEMIKKKKKKAMESMEGMRG